MCPDSGFKRAIHFLIGPETPAEAAFLGEESASRHNVEAVLVQRRDYKGSRWLRRIMIERNGRQFINCLPDSGWKNPDWYWSNSGLSLYVQPGSI